MLKYRHLNCDCNMCQNNLIVILINPAALMQTHTGLLHIQECLIQKIKRFKRP